MKGYGLLKQIISLQIFNGCPPQILLGSFLNTLSKMNIAVIEKQFVLVPYYSLALKTRSGVFLEHCFLFKANQLLNIASWNGSQNSTDRQQKLSLGPLTYLGSLLCNMLHWKGNKLQVDTHVWWPWGAIVKFKNKN